jgi:hypothetical protein
LEVGIVIQKIVYLGELPLPGAVSSKYFEGIAVDRPETIQGTHGQGSVQTRVASNLHMIVLGAVDTGNAESKGPASPLDIIATYIDDHRIQTRRTQGSSIQKNVSGT